MTSHVNSLLLTNHLCRSISFKPKQKEKYPGQYRNLLLLCSDRVPELSEESLISSSSELNMSIIQSISAIGKVRGRPRTTLGAQSLTVHKQIDENYAIQIGGI